MVSDSRGVFSADFIQLRIFGWNIVRNGPTDVRPRPSYDPTSATGLCRTRDFVRQAPRRYHR